MGLRWRSQDVRRHFRPWRGPRANASSRRELGRMDSTASRQDSSLPVWL